MKGIAVRLGSSQNKEYKRKEPDTMAHTCNPSFSGSRDQED
jgi:hypothetical protein